VGVLCQAIGALVDGGVLLDLQSVPPEPVVEHRGVELGRLVSPAFWAAAAANNTHLEALTAAGALVEEASDRFEVLIQWPSGCELADEWQPARRIVPESPKTALRPIAGECVIRESCLTVRYRYTAAPSS
jgi:hypothetical protein